MLIMSGCAQALKAEDIYKKSIEAGKNLNSMHMDMQMKMALEQDGNKMNVDSDINADVITKPETAFDMKMKMDSLGQKADMQMVLSKDGLFVKDPTGNWTKLPKEQMDQILTESLKESYDPAKQFEQLQQFVSDFQMTESGDAYTFKLDANGEKFKQFVMDEVKKQLESQMQGQEGVDMGAVLKDMKINTVTYTLEIDKKTFNPRAFAMTMNLEIAVMGQTVKMDMDVKSSFSKFNEIKEIKTPEGAK